MSTLRRAAPAAALAAAALAVPATSAHATAVAASGQGAPQTTLGSGPSRAALEPAVDAFRTALGGVNNGVGGRPVVDGLGRREINWDGVPNQFASPNAFPADFFNKNSPRGAVFSTPGTALRVSATQNNPTATPPRFGELQPGNAAQFTTFSPERLFTPIGATATDVDFRMPGKDDPATVSGFGTVVTDVDAAGATWMEAYDVDGGLIGRAAAPPQGSGLSFMGIKSGEGDPRIARVRLQLGTANVETADGPGKDVVVMDDFVYGEPTPAPAPTPKPDPAPPVAPPAAQPPAAQPPAAQPPAAQPTALAIAPQRLLAVRVKGRRVSYVLAEAGTVRVRVERRRGRGYVALRRVVTVKGKVGRNSVALPRLRRGAYRVVLVARDGQGHAIPAVRKAFRIR